MNNDKLRITWSIENGNEGINNEESNPLSRALNKLLEVGQPFSRLSLCLFEDIVMDKNRVLRWFGVFVLSEGGKIIFFPGFNIKPNKIIGYKDKSLHWKKYFIADHLSMENDFLNWHFTAPKSNGHLGGIRTVPLDYNRFLWFGMSIAKSDLLRDVKKQTIIFSDIPSSDCKRRFDLFNKSRESAIFPKISINEDAEAIGSNGFFHFSVIVGTKDFPLYNGEQHCFPKGSPFLREDLPDKLFNLPVRYHKFSLSNKIDIQISCFWLPGILNGPIAFTVQY